MFSAAPKAKDSDEEDDKKREKGKKDQVHSNKKPVEKTVETSSGMETQVQKTQVFEKFYFHLLVLLSC